MNYITILGYIAGIMTTLAFLPQLIKIRRSRSTKDISLMMFIVICTGVALWLVYGICIDSLPIIAANIVTLIVAGMILAFKIKYK